MDAQQIDIHDVSIESLQMGWLTEEVVPLPEFSLMYIGGKPAGLMTMSTRDGQPLPDWLTPGYIKDVLEEIDIGSQYIALLKRLLIDDPTESVQRQALYKSQLSIQLPMLALEKKIRAEAGFTEHGWQVLDRLFQPDPAPWLCIRPLAFHAYEGCEADYVANMFVFGARDIQSGPFVLYRPFAADALLEFPTWAALMTAIKQPGELQELVLAWLDDDARSYYADGGFERPHLESVLVEGFLALLPRSPATLGTQYVQGDIFEAMFRANADALVTLSDRQTVSRSERRWILLKRYAWSAFNGLTFFVSGPLQKTAWLFQTLISLQSGLQARIDGDKQAATQTVIDLLFNISLALLHEGLRFNAAANDRLRLKPPIDEPMFTLSTEEKPAPAVPPEVVPLRQKTGHRNSRARPCQLFNPGFFLVRPVVTVEREPARQSGVVCGQRRYQPGGAHTNRPLAGCDPVPGQVIYTPGRQGLPCHPPGRQPGAAGQSTARQAGAASQTGQFGAVGPGFAFGPARRRAEKAYSGTT